MPTYGEYEEIENSEFDSETEPCEFQCNDCGWTGVPSSCITTCGGQTYEELCCPRGRVYTSRRDWIVMSLDPFEVPLGVGESIGPFEAPVATRIAPAVEGPQQAGLFEEVA